MFHLYFLCTLLNLFFNRLTFASEELLTAELINIKIEEILSDGEGIRRENNTFQFKKYLLRSENSSDPTIQANAIKSLRRLFVNPDLKKIIAKDLNESPEFIYKRLMHAELVHQKQADNSLYHSSHFNQFSGAIYVNGSALSGTLIPLPIGGKIVWHVLTCSHFLNGVGLRDNGELKPTFIPFGKPPIYIKNIQIFKERRRNVQITNLLEEGRQTFCANSVEFPDVRGTPLFDRRGDVALCELKFSPEQHMVLSNMLGVKSAIWNHNTLEVKRKLDEDVQTIFFDFVDNTASAQRIFRLLREQPKNHNHIIGYMSLIPSTFTLQVSHTRGESISIFDTNKLGDTIDEFNFTHDIPTHWGMSGGAVVQINNKNEIRVFGVVKSGLDNIGNEREPELASLCSASFLRKELINLVI